MFIKKLKEILPLLSSCLVVLAVGIVCFSLTQTDAALISDNITPPPVNAEEAGQLEIVQDLKIDPESKKPLADDAYRIISTADEDNYTNTTGLTYTTPVFVADDNVELDGTFLNDVFVAGNNVTVRGYVQGDVLAAGANVTITALVDGDVRAAGQNVTIGDSVSGNVTVAGSIITVLDNAVVGRSLSAWGETVTLDGQVGGSLYGGMQNLYLNGSVQQDAHLSKVGEITVGTAAYIGGNLEYQAATASNVPEQTVAGKILFHAKAADHKALVARHHAFWSLWLVFKLTFGLVGYIVLGLVCVRLMSKRMIAVTAEMRTKPFASFGWGVLYFVLLPIVVIILAGTVIGLPLSLALVLVALLLGLVAKLYVGLVVGQLLLPKVKSVYGQFVLGFVLVYVLLALLGQATFIGHVFSTLLCGLLLCWSTGAILKQCAQKHE